MEKTLTLSLQDWENIDMALDIAILRARDRGSPEAKRIWTEVQKRLRQGLEGENDRRQKDSSVEMRPRLDDAHE